MKISDRFTDYGLIGGFFWMLQCSVWGFFTFPKGGWDQLLQGLKPGLTEISTTALPYVPSLVALLGALAIIAIFTTGLLLDLLGSAFFRGLEARVFIAHLRRNKRWLESVMDQNKDYIQEDFLQLLDANPIKKGLHTSIKLVMFWKPHYLREYVNAVRESWRLSKPYTRVQSFLLSYVLLTSGAEKIELLSTQMSLWNTSRAIATGMALGAIQSTIIVFAYYGGNPDEFPAMLYVLQLVLTVVAMTIVYSAHARVCNTLFAFTYVVANKTSVTAAKAAI
jgi:hypothetical protein